MPRPKASADGNVNKSAAVRELLSQHPMAKSKEIVSLLAEKGIKVSANLVYLIKSKAKARKRRQRRENAMAASRGIGTGNPVELILKVKRLAEDTGGIRKLKQLVDVLAE